MRRFLKCSQERAWARLSESAALRLGLLQTKCDQQASADPSNVWGQHHSFSLSELSFWLGNLDGVMSWKLCLERCYALCSENWARSPQLVTSICVDPRWERFNLMIVPTNGNGMFPKNWKRSRPDLEMKREKDRFRGLCRFREVGAEHVLPMRGPWVHCIRHPVARDCLCLRGTISFSSSSRRSL